MRIICLISIVHRVAMATGSTVFHHDPGPAPERRKQVYDMMLAFSDYTEYKEANLRKVMAKPHKLWDGVRPRVYRVTPEQIERTISHLASLSVEQRNLLVKFDPQYEYLRRSIDSRLYQEYVRVITGIKEEGRASPTVSRELDESDSDTLRTIMDLMNVCAYRDEVFPTLKDLVPSSNVVFAVACTRLAEIAPLNDVSMALFVRELSHQDLKPGAPLLVDIFGSPPLVVDSARAHKILEEPFEQLVLEAHVVALEVDRSMSGVVHPERTRSIVSILMNPLDDRIVPLVAEKPGKQDPVSLVAEQLGKQDPVLQGVWEETFRRSEASGRAHLVETHRAQFALYVGRILGHETTAPPPHYDHSYIERITKGVLYSIGNSAKCVLDLLDTLEPEQVTVVMMYDGRFRVLHNTFGSCDMFDLYVSMVTNRPIALEHEHVLDIVLSEMMDIMPSLGLLIDACNLAPRKGQGDGLPESGCRALALLASRSDLAMALVIWSIIRMSIPKIFGIEVPLFTDRVKQIEASSIIVLVEEVRLAATAISGVDTTSSPVERTKAIMLAMLADRSAEATAIVKVIEEKQRIRKLARSVVEAAKKEQEIALERQWKPLNLLELGWSSEIRTQMNWLDAGRQLRLSATSPDERLFMLALADPSLGIEATRTEQRLRRLSDLRGVSNSIFGGTKWDECLKGNCGDLQRAIRGTPFAFSFFVFVMLRERNSAAIVTQLCAQAFSRRFRLTVKRETALRSATFETIFYAIQTKFPMWNGGSGKPSTREIFKGVLNELIKQQNGVISPMPTVD